MLTNLQIKRFIINQPSLSYQFSDRCIQERTYGHDHADAVIISQIENPDSASQSQWHASRVSRCLTEQNDIVAIMARTRLNMPSPGSDPNKGSRSDQAGM